MKLNKRIFAIAIFTIFISIATVNFAANHLNSDLTNNHLNNDLTPGLSNDTNNFGCCSIVMQLEDNDTLMSYRRDSNYEADVFIEKVNWHGIPAIKQYKTENKYFNHVIITNNGWVIGLGGIDDGIDSERCENITAKMISDDYSISEKYLTQIQDIKKPYGRGHVVIKAPNGNYGFATPTKMKTGKLNPGEYISIPNDYELSRKGRISLNTKDRIKAMVNLSQTDLYGLDRREIIAYNVHLTNDNNTTDIYVANEDGTFVGENYTDCIDNVILNNTTIKAKDIPIAPNYKKIGSISFEKDKIKLSNLEIILLIIGIITIIAILFSIVLKIIRFVKIRIYRRRRKRNRRYR